MEWAGCGGQQAAYLVVTTRRRDECFAGDAAVVQAVTSQSLFLDQRNSASQARTDHGGNQARRSGTNTDQIVITALRILPISRKSQLLEDGIFAVVRLGVHQVSRSLWVAAVAYSMLAENLAGDPAARRRSPEFWLPRAAAGARFEVRIRSSGPLDPR